MRYFPVVLFLIGLVMFMAGSEGKGIRVGQNIALVVLGFVVLALLFAVVVARAL